MKNNETLLTNELYETIINNLIKDVVQLKKDQDDTISKISIEISALKSLRKQLKQIKKDIKQTRKSIHKDKNNLKQINKDLSEINQSVIDLNYSFITEGDSYIDTDSYSSTKESTKLR